MLYFCTIFEKECYNHIFQNIDKIDVLKKKTKRNVIKDYLVSKGIPASKITTEAYGETKAAATNRTSKGRALNRRVEIKLTK